MKSLKKRYDRVLLAVAAVLALVMGVVLVRHAGALPSQFERTVIAHPPGILDTDLAKPSWSALAHLDAVVEWVTPTLHGFPDKPLALCRSVPLLVKDRKLYDLLDPRTPALRPPLSNRFLHNFGLPAQRSDVASLDSDGDGFTNAEEYLANETNPRDPADHPPFTDKLCLAGIATNQFSLIFGGGDGDSFSVRETQQLVGEEGVTSKTNFGGVGDRFGILYPGRWQATAFEQKRELNPRTGAMRDVSVLTVEDLSNPAAPPLQLRRGEPFELPTHHAKFRFDLPGFESAIAADPKVGESFTLPCEPGVSYVLTELSGELQDGAVIRRADPTPGEAVVVPPCADR